MIKRIPVARLRVGMYIHKFCGSWIDHPFWRPRFTLRTDAELNRVLATGVREIWIDPAKGIDSEPDPTAAAFEVDDEPPPDPPDSDLEVSMPYDRERGGYSQTVLAEAAALIRRSMPEIAALFGQARLGRLVETARTEALADEIVESVVASPSALISVARLKRRDEYTFVHSMAVSALMVALGRECGLDRARLRKAALGGLLHDLGKALMPLAVLNKPGELTDDEYALARHHPQHGHDLLAEACGADPDVLDVCLHHHEKVDGSGYPHALAGDRLGLFAKMGAVCDVYDATTSTRPYKPGWDPADALRRMAQWKGHFDDHVFQALVKAVGIYPVGALVRLGSGRLAVVTAHNPQALLAPRVKAFFSTRSGLRIVPQEIDLSHPRCHDRLIGCEPLARWRFDNLEELWLGGDAPG